MAEHFLDLYDVAVGTGDVLKQTARNLGPILMLPAVLLAIGISVLVGPSSPTAEAGGRPTCAPFVFGESIDPSIALTDTGTELDCDPPAYTGPGVGPTKQALPVPTASA
jgi:hypothetical protein